MSWVTKQRKIIDSIQGNYIQNVYWVEMALVEADSLGKPIFRHPEIPFIQTSLLQLQFSDGRVGKISIYQNDDTTDNFSNFGLRFEFTDDFLGNKRWQQKVRDNGSPSIYRLVEDLEFPIGQITKVQTNIDVEGDINEIHLRIGDSNILLKSGEVYEVGDGTISVSEQDESILIYLNKNDAVGFPYSKPIKI